MNKYRDYDNYLKEYPDANGCFGKYGGNYLEDPELIKAFNEYAEAYNTIAQSAQFINELRRIRRDFQGRPTPVYHCQNLSNLLGRTQIYLKREDLNHTGAHKLNHCMGEGLLAKYMGKKKLIAETGAGQHGVASATVAARFGYPCVVYMGATDVARQSPNVFRMKLLGAEVRPVTAGHGTLKDAMNEALRDWVTNVEDTYYLIGTAAGPHPYPELVRDFQSVIGTEARQQMLEQEGRLPDTIIAAVGGGSNAIGLFHPFLDDRQVEIIGIEAGGRGLDGVEHCASMNAGRPGVLHGNRTYLLQNEDGQILDGHSVSAGLDYPGVGPEHSFLRDTGRVDYQPILDDEALEAFQLCTRTEGIIPALESAHAIAHAVKIAPGMARDKIIIVNLSGRGDKDVHTVAKMMGMEI